MQIFYFSNVGRVLFMIFLIVMIGYAVGRIRICGVGLGTAAIFLVGLVFGHFGVELPKEVQSLGLVMFITAVGFSAGSGFLQALKKNGIAYASLCITTACIGSVICAIVIKVLGIKAPLALGIMTGAYTTSPGFAAAKEAVSASEKAVSMVASGYGIAYPVGVVCKVLIIQLIPKLLHADMKKERALIASKELNSDSTVDKKQLLRMDPQGMFSFSLAVVLGIILGSIHIPLPGGHSFSLGLVGGPLIIALLMSGIGRVASFDLSCDTRIYNPIKEFGLMLFFSGAGVEGGHGVAEILQNYGIIPMLLAVIFVIIPMIGAFLVSQKVFQLPLLNGLGSMTASMTCTPSLAMLVQLSGTDDVVAAYATTYPIALLTMTLIMQFLATL